MRQIKSKERLWRGRSGYPQADGRCGQNWSAAAPWGCRRSGISDFSCYIPAASM